MGEFTSAGNNPAVISLQRRKSRQIKIGNVKIGGGAPIVVQSMTIADTKNTKVCLDEIHRLEEAGCEVVRVAVPDKDSAEKIGEIKKNITIPLIADIQFNYSLALIAIKQGVDALRLNPGNIPNKQGVREVVKACKDMGIPIRIGVNAGSISKELLMKHGWPTPEALVEQAENELRLLRDLDFHDIKISLKSSDVLTTIGAYRLMANRCDYPLHLGVTEAGTPFAGAIKSAVGIGVLLAEGIGDTLRVSLTGDTVDEVKAGYEMLKALNLRQHGPVIVSCPSCGRCDVDLIESTQKVESSLERLQKEGVKLDGIKVSVMGCEVNGPGEGRLADIGVAFGKGVGLLFKGGEIISRMSSEDESVEKLILELRDMAEKREER